MTGAFDTLRKLDPLTTAIHKKTGGVLDPLNVFVDQDDGPSPATPAPSPKRPSTDPGHEKRAALMMKGARRRARARRDVTPADTTLLETAGGGF